MDEKAFVVKLGGADFALREASELAVSVLDESLKRGLGSLTKKDAEILILHLFLTHTDAWQKPLHELSLLLRMPVARLANHMYEMRLKYPGDNRSYVRDVLSALFARVKFRSYEEKGAQIVEFSVEDKFVRQRILADLRDIGKFGDGSFNKEILKIELDALVKVFERYLDRADMLAMNTVLSAAGKRGAKTSLTTSIFSDLFREFLKGAAGRAGEISVDVAAAAATGGKSVVISLATAIAKFRGNN
ncbi:hypothetical protein [Rhodanobacter thiooxydans]|nr:hypothetical protein [Rhodanobacter thiooxydans]EIL98261.1 hypothetical protein UUA_12373 [Rhodanobacter thiooxydans LCS2]